MAWFRKKKEAEAPHGAPPVSEEQRRAGPDEADLPPVNDAFAQLARQAVADSSGACQQALWKPVFKLERWCFLNRLPPDGSALEGPPPFGWARPMTANVEGHLYVIAFTSEARAVAAAKRNGLVHQRHGIPLLSIPRDEAATMLCAMGDARIHGVLFNHNEGEHGFFAPLSNIAGMFEWYLDRIPPGMFDAFVKGVTSSNAPQAWARLNRRLALMDQWFFIGDQERPEAPRLYQQDGEVFVLMFTDAERATRGARCLEAVDVQGPVPLIPAQPSEAAGYLKAISARSDGKVRRTLFNLGSQPFVETIDDIDRFVALR